MEQLFLNSYECDLSPDTVIALTLQINDVGQMQDRNASFTNTFKLPLTTKNKTVLESAQILQSSTKKPYRRLTAQYIQGGAEIIHNGIAVVESADDNFNVTIYSGNKTFFDIIADKKLSDLDCGDLDFVWTVVNAIGMANNTSGTLFPVVDYGNASLTLRVLYIKHAFPWIFFHTIIERIVSETGYTLAGDILASPVYQNLLVSLPTLKEDEKKLIALAENNTAQQYLTTDLSEVIPLIFDTIISDPLEGIVGNGVLEIISPGFWGPYLQYNVLNTGRYSFVVVIKYTIVDTDATVFQVAVSGAAPDEFLAQSATIAADGITVTGTVTLQVTGAALTAGDIIVARAIAGQDFGSSGSITIEIQSTFECTKVDSPIIAFETWFPVALNLPDLTQKDFFKVLLQLFGLFIQIDELTKVITLTRFTKIIANRNITRDWSDKRDPQKPPTIQYRIGNYAQKNWLRYKDDSMVSKYLGDGMFTIDDTTLKESSDQFSLPFAATEMGKRMIGLDVPIDLRVTTDPDTSEVTIADESSPRLLLLHKQDLGADNIKYVNAPDDLSGVDNLDPENLAYFILPGKDNTLGFADVAGSGSGMMQRYYPEFIKTLDQCKKVTAFYRLNVHDVADFDFSIPVYDSFFGNYFYVNRISQFIDGQLTQVELVRIKDYSVAGTINASSDVCEGDGANIISISGIEGGAWSCYDSDGNFIPGGVFNYLGDEYFDPSATGVGVFTIKYTTADVTIETEVEVHAQPTLDSFADVSHSDPPFLLTGGLPLGGTYSVDGVEKATFDPSSYSVGLHFIGYTTPFGCAVSQPITVTA